MVKISFCSVLKENEIYFAHWCLCFLWNLQVYLTLCCALVASTFGAYLHVIWNIGGILTTIGCVGTMIWLLSCPPYEQVRGLDSIYRL